MIELTLEPHTLFTGRPTRLAVIARNTGAGACTTLRARLELPPEVVLVGGSTGINAPRVVQRSSCVQELSVEAQRPGSFAVGVVGFSYSDPRGRSRYPGSISLILDVRPAEEAPEDLDRRPPENPRPARRGKVFISYRRDDGQDLADRLRENLSREFGANRVFLDRERRQFGRDFRERIDAELRSSTAMLVLIGPRWNPPVMPGDGHRLDDDNDPVRSEIRAGLQLGLWIIPVMFGRARMPPAGELPEDIRQLTYFEYLEIRDTGVDADTFELLTTLRQYVQ